MISHIERPILARQVLRITKNWRCEEEEWDFLFSVIGDLVVNPRKAHIDDVKRSELWSIFGKYSAGSARKEIELVFN